MNSLEDVAAIDRLKSSARLSFALCNPRDDVTALIVAAPPETAGSFLLYILIPRRP
jgi:hypothetical protein